MQGSALGPLRFGIEVDGAYAAFAPAFDSNGLSCRHWTLAAHPARDARLVDTQLSCQFGLTPCDRYGAIYCAFRFHAPECIACAAIVKVETFFEKGVDIAAPVAIIDSTATQTHNRTTT